MARLCHGLIYLILCSQVLFANEIKNTLNTFGSPGIIDVPIAGSLDDGEMLVSISKFGSNLRNSLSFQALPNVYGTFRYSGVGNKNTGYYKTSGFTTWDRSFDLRVDLLKESDFVPNLTIGLQDFIGTGIYSGEYLVASKKFSNIMQTTVGLGWGRLASSNIIKRSNRKADDHGKGGDFNINQFFTGDIGLFAGVKSRTPVKNLIVKAEISSDNYKICQTQRQILELNFM